MANAGNIEAAKSSYSTPTTTRNFENLFAWVIQNRFIFKSKIRYFERVSYEMCRKISVLFRNIFENFRKAI